METKKRHILTIIITFVFALAVAVGVGLWNMNVASQFSGMLRYIMLTVIWWPMLIATIFFMRRDKESLKDIGFSKEKIPLQILLGIAVAIGSLLIFIVLPALFSFQMGFIGSLDIRHNLMEFFYILFAVAMVEEIIFRGHLYKKFKDMSNSTWIPIVGSSVLFGLFHILNFNLLQLAITTLIGIYLCVCREKLRHCTLLSLIVAHALHNLFLPIVTAFLFR